MSFSTGCALFTVSKDALQNHISDAISMVELELDQAKKRKETRPDEHIPSPMGDEIVELKRENANLCVAYEAVIMTTDDTISVDNTFLQWILWRSVQWENLSDDQKYAA